MFGLIDPLLSGHLLFYAENSVGFQNFINRLEGNMRGDITLTPGRRNEPDKNVLIVLLADTSEYQPVTYCISDHYLNPFASSFALCSVSPYSFQVKEHEHV